MSSQVDMEPQVLTVGGLESIGAPKTKRNYFQFPESFLKNVNKKSGLLPKPKIEAKCLPPALEKCSVFAFDEFVRLETEHLETPKQEQSKIRANQLKERRLFVTSSQIHGLGLFTTNEIGKDEIVMEYTGEILTKREAEVRQMVHEYHDEHNFMMASSSENQIIDAAANANCSKFINHSCNPNCTFEYTTAGSKNRVIVLTLRQIAPGEELTCDYNWTAIDESQNCCCGSPNCRKFINPPPPPVRRSHGKPPKSSVAHRHGPGRPSKSKSVSTLARQQKKQTRSKTLKK